MSDYDHAYVQSDVEIYRFPDSTWLNVVRWNGKRFELETGTELCQDLLDMLERMI